MDEQLDLMLETASAGDDFGRPRRVVITPFSGLWRFFASDDPVERVEVTYHDGARRAWRRPKR